MHQPVETIGFSSHFQARWLRSVGGRGEYRLSYYRKLYRRVLSSQLPIQFLKCTPVQEKLRVSQLRTVCELEMVYDFVTTSSIFTMFSLIIAF